MSTARDVAKAANVALPTAYEALRGAGRLSPETRKRILDAAARLKYKPSAAARAMNDRETRQIGVIGKLHPVSTGTYLGANAALLEADRVMSILAYEEDNLDQMQQRAFKERMFDGMIVIDQVPDQIYDELQEIEHCIWVNTDRYEDHDCIQREEFEVGRTAATQLLEAGWLELVFVYGPKHQNHYSHTERLRGIRSAAKSAGARVHVVACEESGTTWHQLNERLAPYFAEGAFIFSDTYRVRAMQTVFMHHGFRPGRDISVVCCDDVRDFELTWPELSRAEFDRPAMGRLAIDMLMHRLTTGRPQPSHRVCSRWIEGTTVADRRVRDKSS